MCEPISVLWGTVLWAMVASKEVGVDARKMFWLFSVWLSTVVCWSDWVNTNGSPNHQVFIPSKKEPALFQTISRWFCVTSPLTCRVNSQPLHNVIGRLYGCEKRSKVWTSLLICYTFLVHSWGSSSKDCQKKKHFSPPSMTNSFSLLLQAWLFRSDMNTWFLTWSDMSHEPLLFSLIWTSVLNVSFSDAKHNVDVFCVLSGAGANHN